LQTEFSVKYYQNYQDQLLHLRVLSSVAANPTSKAKIMDIRKKIVKDIWQELRQHFEVVKINEKPRAKMIVEVKLSQNEGKVKFCA